MIKEIKEHSEFTLGNKTKWELVKELSELEKRINKALKRLDKLEGKEIWKIMQLLRGEK